MQDNTFLKQNKHCSELDEGKTKTVTVANSLCHVILFFFCG